MKSQDFFWSQSHITKVKLDIYKEYIESYSIILLMQFWAIFIADLFCGPGYNWKEKWSPLQLIDTLNLLLDNPALMKKQPWRRVVLAFNDANPKNITDLKAVLQKYPVHKNITILFENKWFKELAEAIPARLWKKDIPKFFFLDPFSYSSVNFEDIRSLFEMKLTEILLFSPVTDLYRFVNAKNLMENPEHKTRKAIEELTEKWVWCDYESTAHFCDAIVEKFKKELKQDYFRYVLLDNGKRKNWLFYLTSHVLWLLKFNRIVRKIGDMWDWVDIKEVKERHTSPQICLQFSKEDEKALSIDFCQKIKNFENFLLTALVKPLSNIGVIKLCAINEILPEEVRNFIEKSGKFRIKLTGWKRMWSFLSDGNWNEEKCIISLID